MHFVCHLSPTGGGTWYKRAAAACIVQHHVELSTIPGSRHFTYSSRDALAAARKILKYKFSDLKCALRWTFHFAFVCFANIHRPLYLILVGTMPIGARAVLHSGKRLDAGFLSPCVLRFVRMFFTCLIAPTQWRLRHSTRPSGCTERYVKLFNFHFVKVFCDCRLPGWTVDR